ncbi:TIGR01244 family sulfur transferase [Fodinicurvata halophila]|uniref:TIGR01244 family sulfur transferase n=1 Tax=Fodinicurvata halophila TaxID=1419723 RepID=UPI00361FFB72
MLSGQRLSVSNPDRTEGSKGMVQTTELENGIYTAGQISQEDIPDLAEAGFRTIINNRPDGEEAGQPPYSDTEHAAQAKGINYYYIPLTQETLTPEKVARFREAMEEAPRPVLVHCRSGARSTLLWALSEARYNKRSTQDLIDVAGRQGKDISSASPLIDHYRAWEDSDVKDG